MQPVPSSIIKTSFPKDRENILQELYIRKPTESNVLSALGNLVWRGRTLPAIELLCTAQKNFPDCPEIKILSAHLALIKGRGLLAHKLLEDALCSHPEHLGIRMLWAYVASLDKVLRLIPPKHNALANIEKTFSKDHDTKAALNCLVKSDVESALLLAERVKMSDSSWLRYIYLSASTGETYEQKKPYFEAFSQEKLAYPPFLAASILADMLQHKDYQTLRRWLSHNMTLPYDVPAIGIVVFLLEIIEGNEEAARNVKNRLLEQSPEPEITSALFIGSEKCELIIENLLPDLAQRAIHGLKELADILYDLRHFVLAEKCYKLCTEHFPNDSVIWHRLGYAASYGDAEDATIEAYFTKALSEAKSKKEITSAYSAIGLAAIRQRDYKKAIHYLADGVNSPLHLFYLGYASLRLGDIYKAADYLTFSLVQDEKNPRTRYLLGMISLARKDVKMAKEHFAMALTANQLFGDAHIELARLAVAEKAYLIASRHIDLALIYEFENPVCWEIKGNIYLAQNNIEDAHICFLMQYRLDFLDGQAILNLAETHFRKEQPEMALNLLQKLPEKSSPDYQRHLNRVTSILEYIGPCKIVDDVVQEYDSQKVVHPDLPPLKGRLHFWKTTEAKNYAEAFAIVMQQTPDIEKMEGYLTKRRLLWLRCNHEPESKATKNILDNPLKASLTIPEKAVPELVYNKDVWDKELEIFKAAREKHVYEAALMALYTLSKLNQIKKKDRDRRFTPFHSSKSPANLTLADLEKIKL